MTRNSQPPSVPVDAKTDASQAPIPFPAANQASAAGYLRQMRQAEAQMRSAEHQANLIIEATAVALNVSAGWRLDMRGDTWQFVPPPVEGEGLEISQNEPQ